MAGNDRARNTTKTDSNGVLCITEKWIREHLNLQKDTLDDVRSISLPGSYYEKITHLSRSLAGFVRLKHLDLSRNALESLEGLEHLKHLESLNIYYNNIGSLTELFRLRHNKKLKDLDLRLNPVTKNETDYRLFMVHMLVNLRKLDDRGVRDAERRAALLHFNSDQAHLFDRSLPSSTPVASSRSGKHLSSRKELVKSLAPRPSCLDNDTDELLDLISKRDQARQLHTPSHHHSLPTHSGDKRGVGHFTLTPTPRSLSEPEQSSITNDDAEIVKVGRYHSDDGVPAALEDLLGFMQWFVDGDLGPLQRDSEFKDKFSDWLRAHIPPPSIRPHTSHHTRPRDEQERQGKLEESVRDLQQQLDNVTTNLQEKDAEITQLKGQLQQSQADSNVLSQHFEESRTKLSEEVSGHKRSREELRHQLGETVREATSLHEIIATLKEENASLRTTLDQAPPTSRLDTFKQQIRSLEVEKDDLRAELEAAAERGVAEADTMTQLHQLAVMLQESHRSLVATNSHLLQELEESKLRHSQELSQMNMNYNTLRKTIDLYASST